MLQSLIDGIADTAGDNRVRHSYGADGAEAKRTDAMGQSTSYAYNAFGERVGVSAPASAGETYTLDRRGLRVQTELAGSGLLLVTSTVYDAFGRAERTEDANGNVRTYSYDRSGRQVAARDPLGGGRSTTYDAFDRVLTETDARGNITSYAYDKDARSIAVSRAGAGTALSVFNVHGEVATSTDANGHLTTYSYDRDGHVLTKTVDPDGLKLKTTYSYDEAGRVLKVRSPTGSLTEYVYDALGRRTQERVDPEGLDLKHSWTYDANGNAVTSTDARGLVTRYAYDAAGRLTYTVDPAGNTRVNNYDEAGRVILTKSYATPIDDPKELGTSFSVADVKARVTRSASDLVEYRVLDDAGRVLATVDGTGAVVAYAYDRNGNVVKRTAYAEPIALDDWTRGTVPKPKADAAHDSLRSRPTTRSTARSIPWTAREPSWS
ncbi:RHS repeat protein [Ramlibacter terrae]|uniref:RHS repeat protein n=1 Tax=Ramlibacter terrae TaxID=2732511 RepID=A0ABX6P188_9BURK|nr:RHS repeat protein [Ramlibacter terrae]